MKPKEKKLPNKLSALIELAVKDARSVARDKGYLLDMVHWHVPDADAKGRCAVCMAGAVMVREFEVSRNDYVQNGSLEDRFGGDSAALRAVDMVRGGYLSAALSMLGHRRSVRQLDAVRRASELIQSKMVERTERAPWTTYLKAARILRRAGL